MGRTAGKEEEALMSVAPVNKNRGDRGSGSPFCGVGELPHPIFPQLFLSQLRGRGRSHTAETATHVMACGEKDPAGRCKTFGKPPGSLQRLPTKNLSTQSEKHDATLPKFPKLLTLVGPRVLRSPGPRASPEKDRFQPPTPCKCARLDPELGLRPTTTTMVDSHPCCHASLGLEMRQLTGAGRR
jgi:hypothetical protein